MQKHARPPTTDHRPPTTDHRLPTMFAYTAYGLHIHSALELPELVAAARPASADLVISYGPIERRPTTGNYAQGDTWGSSGEAYLFWEDAGAFLVRGGREIIVHPLPGVEERVTRLFLLGAALGVLLYQRELVVLHASAVALNGSAVAFLGESGAGKSTMAAAMHAYGYEIIADDIT